jgi:hypothetical protein
MPFSRTPFKGDREIRATAIDEIGTGIVFFNDEFFFQ